MDSPLFRKLWRVASIQKHFDPWHPRLLQRTEAQLDAILEAYSEDHPKELKFERKRTREAKDRPLEVLRGWADVLIGDAKAQLVRKVSFKLPPRFQKQPGPIRLPPTAVSGTPTKPRPKPAAATQTPRPMPRRR